VTLLLTRTELDGLLEFEPLVESIEAAFVRHGLGKGLPIVRRHMPGRGGGFHVVIGGSQLEEAVFTAKVTAHFGRPNGFTALFSAETGEWLALMDSAYLTGMRTAAMSLVALPALTLRSPLALLIVGAGKQAEHHCRALRGTPRYQDIELSIYARDPGSAQRLATDFAASVAAELPAAVASADVVITLTSAREPLFPAAAVNPGTTVLALGSDGPGKQELDPELLTLSRVVVDVHAQARESGELQHADADTAAAATELSDVLAGRAPGRTSDDEIVVFDATGTAIQDGVAAAQLLAAARARDRGTTLALQG
jgi:ornithine cyclodeaminase/alanine dehydrogenase-like protein (mu-crystallin family)